MQWKKHTKMGENSSKSPKNSKLNKIIKYRSFFLSRVICLSIGSAISRQRKGFDDAYEKTKVTCHENIPMSFYKPWSKILHKAAKGWRRSKMKAKWRIVTFLLSHCTVCPFPLFPPLFSQLLHQLLTWLKKMKKSLKFCWFWLKTTEWVNYRCSTGRYCGRGRTLVYPVYRAWIVIDAILTGLKWVWSSIEIFFPV